MGASKKEGAAGTAPASATSDKASKDVKVHLAIYYGTQTGTSERFANEVAAGFFGGTDRAAPLPTHVNSINVRLNHTSLARSTR